MDEVIAPDVLWRIEGSSSRSGVFRGRAEFMEKAVRPFTSRLSVPVRPVDVRVFAIEAWAFLDLDPYDDVLRRIPAARPRSR
jgi:hypothetical protein